MTSVVNIINLIFSGIQFMVGLALMGAAVFGYPESPVMAFFMVLLGFGAVAVSYATLKFRDMFAGSREVRGVLRDRKFYMHVALFSMPVVGIIIGIALGLQ